MAGHSNADDVRTLESGGRYKKLFAKDDGELNEILRRNGLHRKADLEKDRLLGLLLVEYECRIANM